MELRECLTFDDVLLIPQLSSVVPADVDCGTSLSGLKLAIPILSAAMDTVTEAAMAAAMARAGGCGVVHKNLSPAEQAAEIRKARKALGAHAAKGSTHFPTAAVAVGVRDWEQRLGECERFVNLAVVDSAHGHSVNVLRAVSDIKAKYPKMKIMAGNVSTAVAVRALVESGADIVKIGQGPGTICTTRLVSGCGMPQFTAVADCAEEADKHDVSIVADGGIRNSGDIVKALAAGADAVMIGSLLAGTDEAPGELMDRRWKVYRGMGSVGAMERGSKDRYGQSGVSADKLVPEGVEAKVPYVGPLSAVLHQLVGGLRSGMGYVGAANIKELQRRARFVRVTAAGIRENGVHDVS
jgi:IMP dehydrogenase